MWHEKYLITRAYYFTTGSPPWGSIPRVGVTGWMNDGIRRSVISQIRLEFVWRRWHQSDDIDTRHPLSCPSRRFHVVSPGSEFLMVVVWFMIAFWSQALTGVCFKDTAKSHYVNGVELLESNGVWRPLMRGGRSSRGRLGSQMIISLFNRLLHCVAFRVYVTFLFDIATWHDIERTTWHWANDMTRHSSLWLKNHYKIKSK